MFLLFVLAIENNAGEVEPDINRSNPQRANQCARPFLSHPPRYCSPCRGHDASNESGVKKNIFSVYSLLVVVSSGVESWLPAIKLAIISQVVVLYIY